MNRDDFHPTSAACALGAEEAFGIRARQKCWRQESTCSFGSGTSDAPARGAAARPHHEELLQRHGKSSPVHYVSKLMTGR